MTALAIKAALSWLAQHWSKVGTALAVLFLWGMVKGCNENGVKAELAACLAKPPTVITQTVTVKEKCKSSGSVTFKPDSPCPDVVWSHENEGEASLTQTAQINGSNRSNRNGGRWVLETGAERNTGKWDGSTYGGYVWGGGIVDYGLIAGADYSLAFNGPQKDEYPRVGFRLVLMGK